MSGGLSSARKDDFQVQVFRRAASYSLTPRPPKRARQQIQGYGAMVHLRAGLVGVAASLLCTLVLLSTAYARADEPVPQAFNIGPQSLATALAEFARQSREEILFAPDVVAQKQSGGVRGTMPPLAALKIRLKDSGLPFSSTPNGAILVGTAGGSALAASATEKTSDSKKEEKKTPSDGFRVAQVGQGQTSSDSTVEKQDERASKKKPVQLEEV